jgi:hypothetical protein
MVQSVNQSLVVVALVMLEVASLAPVSTSPWPPFSVLLMFALSQTLGRGSDERGGAWCFLEMSEELRVEESDPDK